MKTLQEIKELAGAVLKEVEELENRYTKAGGKRLRKALDEFGKARVRIKREILDYENSLPKRK